MPRKTTTNNGGEVPRIDLDALSLEEKIAQMLVSFRFGDSKLSDVMIEHGWGGIHLSIWDYTTLADSRAMIDDFQKRSKIPLIISSDTETGVGHVMRPDVTRFPSLMAFGATGDPELAYQAGRVTGTEALAVGMNVSYTPVVDVNINPVNPATNTRSYGGFTDNVSVLATALIRGQSETGLASTAKHFPGQGMQGLNSHLDLEVIDVSREEMQRVHLAPYMQAIAAGVPWIMINHAIYAAFDTEMPATLSRPILTDLLRKEMGFEGLIVTDCLEMAAIKNHWSTKEAVALAVLAGNDVILTNFEAPLETFNGLLEAVREGQVPRSRIDESVSRILHFKQQWGIMQRNQCVGQPLDFTAHRKLAEQVAERAITVVRDGGVIPLPSDSGAPVLVIEPKFYDDVGVHISQARLAEPLARTGVKVERFGVPLDPSPDMCEQAAKKAKVSAGVVILADFREKIGQFGLAQCLQLSPAQQELCRRVVTANPRTVAVATNPYTLDSISFIPGLIAMYGGSEACDRVTAEILSGQRKSQGKLPVRLRAVGGGDV